MKEAGTHKRFRLACMCWWASLVVLLAIVVLKGVAACTILHSTTLSEILLFPRRNASLLRMKDSSGSLFPTVSYITYCWSSSVTFFWFTRSLPAAIVRGAYIGLNTERKRPEQFFKFQSKRKINLIALRHVRNHVVAEIEEINNFEFVGKNSDSCCLYLNRELEYKPVVRPHKV